MKKIAKKIWKAQVLHSIFAVAFGNRGAQMTVTYAMVARWSRCVQQSARTNVAWRHEIG